MIVNLQLIDRYKDFESEDMCYLLEVEKKKDLVKIIREINRKEQKENDAYDCDSIANRIEKETGGKLIDYCSIKLDY